LKPHGIKKLLAFIVLAFAVPVYAQYYEEYTDYTGYHISVTANGEEIYFDVPPVIVDGRTLVPVRAVFEFLGFYVEWDEVFQTVILARNSEIRIVIGEYAFTANGETFTLDVPAQIIGDRAMLPIRAVAEAAGYYVRWDSGTSTVQISSEPFPIVRFEIPYRELEEYEIALWIDEYHAFGGALEFEREVIRLTNIERERYGLAPVAEYHTLMLAARFKAQSMYDLNYFAHTSPVYGHFARIARDVFNKPPRTMGENLGNGHRSPQAVVLAWMNSPDHRDNVINPSYTRIGVGFHNYRWAQKFSG